MTRTLSNTLMSAVPALAVATGMSASAQAPNILLIMADDLGWNDVGYHGSEIKTPHIDRIARSGVALERFYVQPTCSPTRSAVMTGKSAARLGVFQPISKLNPKGLPLSEKLLPAYLAESGYQSLMVGKWHLGHAERQYFPQSRGFEHFYGHVTGGIGYWDHNHGGGHDWQRNGVTLREEGYSTRLIANEAVRLLEGRDRGRPTFLFASFNAPHLPNEAPAASILAYPERFEARRRIHAAMVAELDMAVGKILAKLEDQGMSENTLIWFFSDNGGLNRGASPAGLGDSLEFLASLFGEPLPLKALEFIRLNTLDGASDNHPLRAGKTSVYEGGIRVPSAIWWPGHTRAGTSDRFVSAQDVLPTLLSAAGHGNRLPADLDGVPRWAAILGGEKESDGRGGASDFRVQGMGGVALIRSPWKLIVPSSPLPFGDPEPELYHVYDDPEETRNLAQERPDLVDELRAALETSPVGASIHNSLFDFLTDPDSFGGPEDREPWADVAR